jgi:hypothetical protein
MLLVQIPRSVDRTQLKTFLQSQELGSYELLWAYSPTDAVPTIGFRFTRTAKEPGAYYRDPYPVTVCAYSSVFPELPVVHAVLELSDIQELLGYNQ